MLKVDENKQYDCDKCTNNIIKSSKIYSNVIEVRGPFGKYVARSFFSVTDKQTHSCLVSLETAICRLCLGINFIIML